MQKILLILVLGLGGCAGSAETPQLSDVPQTSDKIHTSPEKLQQELEIDKQNAQKKRQEVLEKTE